MDGGRISCCGPACHDFMLEMSSHRNLIQKHIDRLDPEWSVGGAAAGATSSNADSEAHYTSVYIMEMNVLLTFWV